MPGQRRGGDQPWYSTKTVTPPGDTGSSGQGGRLQLIEKGEDLSSVNRLQQQIRDQAVQGNNPPPVK